MQTKGLSKEHLEEYLQIAKNWGIVWENPSKNLLAISDSYEFDHLFYDLIQDEREMCDVIIPYNGVEYYLNVCGMEKEFNGKAQEELIVGSSKRFLISKIIKKNVKGEETVITNKHYEENLLQKTLENFPIFEEVVKFSLFCVRKVEIAEIKPYIERNGY